MVGETFPLSPTCSVAHRPLVHRDIFLLAEAFATCVREETAFILPDSVDVNKPLCCEES